MRDWSLVSVEAEAVLKYGKSPNILYKSVQAVIIATTSSFPFGAFQHNIIIYMIIFTQAKFAKSLCHEILLLHVFATFNFYWNSHALLKPKGDICLLFRNMYRSKQRVSKKLNLIFRCSLNLQKSINQIKLSNYNLGIEHLICSSN